MVKVITFTSSFANTGKYRVAAVLAARYYVNELHQGYGLAYARTAEQANLTAL